ncbi:hypothetical protein GH714_033874 [Hevea brasiliensis]|uniref:NmrA-like domain-containing protein n=1 Tax=Hevea brasiliensis TaxID=3981 RepID=A0A6A6KBW1_HEVBR|nr:hypothetical protein GH714_033874 [Hevea brasiliensis]
MYIASLSTRKKGNGFREKQDSDIWSNWVSGRIHGEGKLIHVSSYLCLCSPTQTKSYSFFKATNSQAIPVPGSHSLLNYEEDVAAYTERAATDPRVANRVIIYRPPENIVSQLDLISSWEKKTGRTFKKIHVPEEEIVKLSETLTFPENIPVSILHNIFFKGDQMSFELTEDDLEASKLYPDHNYTPVDSLLDLCLINPPKPKRAAFA